MLESPSRPVLLVAIVGSDLVGMTMTEPVTKRQALVMAAVLRVQADELEGLAR